MADLISLEIRLASRPNGLPTAANFSLVETKLEPLQDRQVLVRNIFMSVDPYMRGRMNVGKSYVPPFELGKALDGGAVGEVIESRAGEFKPGDAVTSNFGWREYFIASSEDRRIIACGSISGYNDEKPRPGPSNLFNMIGKRLTMKGMIVTDWLDHHAEFKKEVGGYFLAGKLKSKETVVEGIQNAVSAFIGLFEGKNIGKMVVKLA